MAQQRTTRDSFLNTIRTSLGRRETVEHPDYAPLREGLAELEARARAIHERLAAKRPQLVERLERQAAREGWQVARVAGPDAAVQRIREVISQKQARRIIRSDHRVFSRLLDSAIAGMDIQPTVTLSIAGRTSQDLRQKTAVADLGLTGVDYAVAETGSAVLLPRHGVSRLVMLLPPVHIAIVEPEQVVETLEDLFTLRRLAYLTGGGDMGSYMRCITGPSRTADIEQTLVTGVHGPKEVHMLILG